MANETKRFVVTKKLLAVLGSNTILGNLSNLGIHPPCNVVLAFEQSSMGWKYKNKGPDEIIVTEHVPMCLCEEMLTLTRMGYSVTIEEEIVDPE